MEIQTASTFLSELSFFGLTSETAAQVRANLFIQIHEIVFHGKGGYSWETIYNMPRWLRQFTFNKIDEYYKKESENTNESSTSSTLIDPSGKINKENWKHIRQQPSSDKPKVNYK